MEYNKTSINQWLEQYEKGLLNDGFGWYDWFCKIKALPQKTKKLVPAIKLIQSKLDIYSDKYFVLLKNNCPFYGKLYDSLYFLPIDDKSHLPEINLIPKKGFEQDQGAILSFEFKDKVMKEFKAESYSELKKIIVNLDFKALIEEN